MSEYLQHFLVPLNNNAACLPATICKIISVNAKNLYLQPKKQCEDENVNMCLRRENTL